MEQDETRPFKWSDLQSQLEELQRCLLKGWESGEKESIADGPDSNLPTGRNRI